MTNVLTPITDPNGMLVWRKPGGAEWAEPHMGSIALTEGIYGTAWQRHFDDGLWHSSRGGTPKTWEQLITKRNVFLVYDADDRARMTRAMGMVQ